MDAVTRMGLGALLLLTVFFFLRRRVRRTLPKTGISLERAVSGKANGLG